MEIYKGNILKQFIVERLAFGMPTEELLTQFKSQYGTELTEEQLKNYSQQWKTDIATKEQELLEDLKSNAGTMSARVEAISKTSQKIVDELLEKKNYALAERWIGQLKNQLELLAKLYGELKNRSEVVNYTVVQSGNLAALELLERDGIIIIKDKKRLRKMLGISEEGMEQYA